MEIRVPKSGGKKEKPSGKHYKQLEIMQKSFICLFASVRSRIRIPFGFTRKQTCSLQVCFFMSSHETPDSLHRIFRSRSCRRRVTMKKSRPFPNACRHRAGHKILYRIPIFFRIFRKDTAIFSLDGRAKIRL